MKKSMNATINGSWVYIGFIGIWDIPYITEDGHRYVQADRAHEKFVDSSVCCAAWVRFQSRREKPENSTGSPHEIMDE